MTLFKGGKLYKNEFVKNVLTLFSGSVIAQSFLLLITPVLTNHFSTDIFGVFFVYSSIIMVLSIVSTLKYELSIVLTDNEEDAANLLAISLIMSVIVSIFILVIIILFYNTIISLLGDKKIGHWLYFIPASILFVGIFQSFSYWWNRQKKFKYISYGKITKSIGTGTSQLGTGFSGFEKVGLIPGLIFGQFISSIYIFYTAVNNTKQIFKSVSFKKIISTAGKYKDIPLFNTLIGILNTLSNQLPIFMLTRFFGLTSASLYGLSQRVIGVPMGLIGQSVGEVFYQKASETFNTKKDFYVLVKKTYLNLFKVAIIPFILIFFLSSYFEFIFGEEWALSGKYTQVLIPWLLIMFLNSPITHIITILNKQRQMVIYDIFLLAGRFLSLYIGYKIYNDVFVSIMLFSGTGFIFNLFLLFYLLYLSRNAYSVSKGY